ncbi:hypothetical protein VTN02DRAFT_4883 [Thermoascus thermophilus]
MLVQLLGALLLGGLVVRLCLAVSHSHTGDTDGPAQGPEGFYHGQRIADPGLCRQLIAAESLAGKGRNLLRPQVSRAVANRRLVAAFGIDNAFTDTDEAYVRRFVREAQARISLTGEQWREMSALAQDAARGWAVCLRVVLRILFGIEKDAAASDDRLVRLAEAINRAWIASKTPEGSRYGDDRALQDALSAVFPDARILEPRENPLNLILPAFETLWRIVLRTVVEVRFTTGRAHPEWQDILVAFAADPTKGQFERRAATGKGVSAESIVSEALRLYPPTRRVHRAFRWTATDQIIVAADIEACHTARETWGPDALAFNPARFARLTRAQKDAFMPFGAAPFTCPAKPVFGPRIVGLLAGTLLRELAGDWTLQSDNAEVMECLDSGERLCLEREAYEDVFLVRARHV